MALFIIYILRWAICLTLLYSLFRVVLSRETLHSFNRLILLSVMTLSMLLPICQMEFFGGNKIANSVNRVETVITDSVQNARISSPIATVGSQTPAKSRMSTTSPSNYWWIRILVFVYVGGLLVCWLRYMVAFRHPRHCLPWRQVAMQLDALDNSQSQRHQRHYAPCDSS